MSDFVYVGLHDSDAVPEYLQAIADSIRQRKIVLTSGEQRFVATPAKLVRVRVEASRGEEAVHLMVKLSWNEDTAPAGQTPPLLIGPR